MTLLFSRLGFAVFLGDPRRILYLSTVPQLLVCQAHSTCLDRAPVLRFVCCAVASGQEPQEQGGKQIDR